MTIWFASYILKLTIKNMMLPLPLIREKKTENRYILYTEMYFHYFKKYIKNWTVNLKFEIDRIKYHLMSL
jgi:hypothetical protein